LDSRRGFALKVFNLHGQALQLEARPLKLDPRFLQALELLAQGGPLRFELAKTARRVWQYACPAGDGGGA
jgi:hypothetical protein